MVKRVLVLLVGVVALVLSMAAPSSAAVTSRIRNVGSGYCISADLHNGAHMAVCSTGPSQKWTRITRTVGSVTYTKFKHGPTGYCLDGNRAGDIYIHPCNTAGWQDFLVRGRSPYEIKGNLSGDCLDHDGTRLKGNVCNSGNYQRWTFPA